MVRSSAMPSSTVATSRRWIARPRRSATTRPPNWSALVSLPARLERPLAAARSRGDRRAARRARAAARRARRRRRARSRRGAADRSRSRISRGRSPTSVTLPTPGMRSSRVFTRLSANSQSARIDCGPASITARIGAASGSTRSTTGGSASRGSSPRTAATLSRTSCAFSLDVVLELELDVDQRERVARLRCESVRMPSMVLIDSSRTCVTSRSTVSGAAPSSTRGDGDDRELDAREEVDAQARHRDDARARPGRRSASRRRPGAGSRRRRASRSPAVAAAPRTTRTRMPGAIWRAASSDDHRAVDAQPGEHLGLVLGDDAERHRAPASRGRRAR